MRLAKVKKIVFIAICLLGMSIAICYQAADTLDILPSKQDNGDKSYLEGKKYQTLPALTIETYLDGSFQSNIEKYLSDSIPTRDSVLLRNADLQFKFISAANVFTGYETLPTFFGSKYSIDQKQDAIVQNSEKKTEQVEAQYDKAAQAINTLSEENPTLKITLAIPDRIQYSENNSTFQLTSNAIDKRYKNEKLISKLNEGINYVDLSIDSPDDYYKNFFRTDHHWNSVGAYHAYKKIMASSFNDLTSIELSEIKTYKKPKFYGVHARTGLKLPIKADIIEDLSVSLKGTKIKIDGEKKTGEDVQHKTMYSKNKWEKAKFMSRYAEYYHNDYGSVSYETDNNSNRSLLLIGDSYGQPMERYFAKSFDKVVKIDPRHYKGSLKPVINKWEVTDVLILACDPTMFNDKVLKKLNS